MPGVTGMILEIAACLPELEWQQYGFAMLHLDSGEIVQITSLAVPRLKSPFELQNVNVREKLYCGPP
jgi:hypothetical protein